MCSGSGLLQLTQKPSSSEGLPQDSLLGEASWTELTVSMAGFSIHVKRQWMCCDYLLQIAYEYESYQGFFKDTGAWVKMTKGDTAQCGNCISFVLHAHLTVVAVLATCTATNTRRFLQPFHLPAYFNTTSFPDLCCENKGSAPSPSLSA